MKRIFWAINFPEKTKQILEQVQKDLARYLPQLRWVPKENLHLTLVFLGNLQDKERERASQLAYELFEGVKQFSINLSGLGVFPEPRRPRVLWSGVLDNGCMLNSLSSAIFRKLDQAGFKIDQRESKPHVTLGRIKEKINKEGLFFVLKKYQDVVFDKVTVGSIEVMESELKRTGSVYRVLEQVKLSQ